MNAHSFLFVPCDIGKNFVQCNFSYVESFSRNIQAKYSKVAQLLVLAYFFIGHVISSIENIILVVLPGNLVSTYFDSHLDSNNATSVLCHN